MIPRPQHTAQHYPQIMVRFQRIVTLFSAAAKGKEGLRSLRPKPNALRSPRPKPNAPR